MAVGTLEEIIDDNHAIVSTSVGSEYYVNMLSFVDKDLIEPGCTVLLNNKVCKCLIACLFHLHKEFTDSNLIYYVHACKCRVLPQHI